MARKKVFHTQFHLELCVDFLCDWKVFGSRILDMSQFNQLNATKSHCQWGPGIPIHYGNGQEKNSYFTPQNLEVLVHAYGKYEHILHCCRQGERSSMRKLLPDAKSLIALVY